MAPNDSTPAKLPELRKLVSASLGLREEQEVAGASSQESVLPQEAGCATFFTHPFLALVKALKLLPSSLH